MVNLSNIIATIDCPILFCTLTNRLENNCTIRSNNRLLHFSVWVFAFNWDHKYSFLRSVEIKIFNSPLIVDMFANTRMTLLVLFQRRLNSTFLLLQSSREENSVPSNLLLYLPISSIWKTVCRPRLTEQCPSLLLLGSICWATESSFDVFCINRGQKTFIRTHTISTTACIYGSVVLTMTLSKYFYCLRRALTVSTIDLIMSLSDCHSLIYRWISLLS